MACLLTGLVHRILSSLLLGRIAEPSDLSEALFDPRDGAMGLVVALGRSLAGPPFAHLSPRVFGRVRPSGRSRSNPRVSEVRNRRPGHTRAIPGTLKSTTNTLEGSLLLVLLLR